MINQIIDYNIAPFIICRYNLKPFISMINISKIVSYKAPEIYATIIFGVFYQVATGCNGNITVFK